MMPPGKPSTIDGVPIVLSYPYGATGDSRHVLKDGSLWESGPTTDRQFAQPAATGEIRSTIKTQ